MPERKLVRRYLLPVFGDVEPGEMFGPYETDEARERAAFNILADDPGGQDGLYPVDVYDDYSVEVEAFSGGFGHPARTGVPYDEFVKSLDADATGNP